MDETIGVKGGHNDYRRTLIITKKEKKKLQRLQEEKEIKELEKEVKKIQRYSLIKTLPIAVTFGTIKLLRDTGKKKIDKEKENSKWKIKEYDTDLSVKKRKNKETKEIVIIKDGKKQIIKVDIKLPIKQEINLDKKEEVIDTHPIKEDNNTIENIVKKEEVKENKQEKLDKLKARKIIDVYEKELKDIRYELRELIFEYNVLKDESEKIVLSKEAEEILDKLNDVIERIEKLKSKIKIEDLDKYDDNYIYTLIEDYLNEFKDKKIIKEIKDSNLYILISSKLEELDKKKDKLKDKVNNKKEDLEEKEIEFDKLKEKYNSLDKFNNDIKDFYDKQELLLREIKEKIDKSTTITEKVETEFKYMHMQSLTLLQRIKLLMGIPGKRSAKALGIINGSFLNFTKNILNPEIVTKKYKVITVTDYSKDIESSIKSIDDALSLLNKNSKQIDSLIYKIKTDYKEYIGVIKECDLLLSNLEKIKNDIKEKEYEMERMKKEQEKELERNNAKVLKKETIL